MRILHVIFSSRIAGAERYCVDLASRQAALGHDVHVAGMVDSPVADAFAINVTFHGFKYRIFRRILLRRLVRHLSPDICHAHLSPACKALAAMPASVRKVATLHVGYKPHQHAALDGLICVNATQAACLGNYSGLVRTIPNWLPQAPTAVSLRGLREDLRVNKDEFLIGAVGRLHASKGMDVLISAFRAAALARASLVILGEGPQRAQLERLRARDSRIHLPGYRDNVHDCLRDFDLFVSPSREESFGLAIIEAMSMGLPIIATAAEGPREFLLDQPVELVMPGSIEALTEALADAYERFRANDLPRVYYDLGQFDPAAGISSVSRFYAQVIEAKQWRQPTQTHGKIFVHD